MAAASPGPANLALMSTSLASGRASGLRFGLGLSVGLGIWGLVAASGLGAVLQASSFALGVLKVVGGAYLLWLAFRSAQAAWTPTAPLDRKVARGGYFKRGLLLNLANPKAVVAWMAVLALGVDHDSGAAGLGFATAVCMVIGLLIYVAYALAFSTGWAMEIYARIRRWVDGAVAGFFAIAGVGLIRSAFVRQ
ncbi:MAG: LysE family translocator [Pseudomonadota bacterium]